MDLRAHEGFAAKARSARARAAQTRAANRNQPRLPLPQRLLTSGTLIDSSYIPHAEWDGDVLRRVSGADRVGEIALRRTEVFEAIDEFALEEPQELFTGETNSWSLVLGHELRNAVEHRISLWLALARPESLEKLERLLGDGVVTIAGKARDDGRLPIALNPLDLLHAWATDPDRARYLRRMLHDVDTLRTPTAVIATLKEAGVAVRDRSLLARFAINPKAIAYLVVFVYSSLRALPVALVPGFTGRVWILWSIDVTTAIPYTWGVLNMVAGRTRLIRMVGLLVTLITFMAPYVYFWLNGKDYPLPVVILVIAMIVGSAALEWARWLRDRLVTHELRRRG